MNKKTVLVTGSTGQVGSELRHIAAQYPDFKLTFKDRKGMDLTSKDSIRSALENHPYDFLINAAAYTAVDNAETNVRTARQVNSTALNYISQYASKRTKIVHISTDYVYHNDPNRPLKETDKVMPKGIYAQTKLEGEQKLLERRPDSLIMRTSWVYSSYGNNFVKTMLRLGKKMDSLNIVADQYGTPTYARDIANTLMTIIKNRDLETISRIPHNGIFNYSNLGLTNWADFAREIFKQAKIKCSVGETTTAAYGAPAPRPLWSMMSKVKIQQAFHLNIPQWQQSLRKCLLELGYK